MSSTVLTGWFSHETNTFYPEATTRADFEKRRELFGEEIITTLEGTNTSIGGAIDFVDESDIELLPTVAASAQPGGVVSEDVYVYYCTQITDAAEEHRSSIDGIFLPLHGAMVPECMDDGEGPLLRSLRSIVGEETPIVATFDPHANVTDAMVEAGDALVAYETYPHVDQYETGVRAMELLRDFMGEDRRPVQWIERPPMVTNGPMQNTRDGPMVPIMDRARSFEEDPDILKVNVFFGYYKADIPEMGTSILVVADDDEEKARQVARSLGSYLWERREDFIADLPDADTAVAKAVSEAGANGSGPIVLADTGDNPGGGGSADGTIALQALLDHAAENAGFALICDPEAVERCVQAGVKSRVSLSLGGKTDDLSGDPIDGLDGYVGAITDGKFTNMGPMSTGTTNDLGRTVRFECGENDGITVIITENRLQPLDAEIWRHLGVQPERLDLLVVKSTNHYRADYEPMASAVYPMNTPGLDATDPSTFSFEHIPRPMYPIDDVSPDAYPD